MQYYRNTEAFEHWNDVLFIQECALKEGMILDPEEANDYWRDYSRLVAKVKWVSANAITIHSFNEWLIDWYPRPPFFRGLNV